MKLRHGSSGPLEAFVDADWVGDKAYRKSNTSFIFSLWGSVSWAARKQSCVTLSLTEVEFVALFEASRKLMWLHELKSTGDNKRTKHIDTRFNYAKKLVYNGVMIVRYCPSDKMVVDGMTKPLAHVNME